MISCATPPSLSPFTATPPLSFCLFFTLPSPVLAKLACDLAAIQAIRNVSLVAVTQVATPPLSSLPPSLFSTQSVMLTFCQLLLLLLPLLLLFFLHCLALTFGISPVPGIPLAFFPSLSFSISSPLFYIFCCVSAS